MGIVFNAGEVFEMAKQIERNGAIFYRRAAEGNAGAREFLLQIAAQEDQHLAIFTRMQEKLSESEEEPAALDLDGEAGLYLKAMADAKVFTPDADPAAVLKGVETLDDIIEIALGKEKDSIVFYAGMMKMLPRKLGRAKLDLIIEEELRHIRWLTGKRSGVAE